MNQIHGLILVVLLLLGAALRPTAVVAQDEPSFHVKPKRCVALRQGQNCYQKLTFKWQTPNEGEYCLRQDSHDKPVICWKGRELTKYSFKFSSQKEENFYIFDEASQKSLSTTTVRVVWVYRNKKKEPSGWRLF